MTISARPWISAVIALLLAGCSDAPEENVLSLTSKAERGDASAQFKLAVKLHDLDSNKASEEDKRTAFKWYKKAADQGHTEAEFHTGICYYYRLGVDGDPSAAARYLKKAADKNHVWAQVQIAECYASGYGVPKDEKQAFEWLNRAAKQDNLSAIYKISTMYNRGEGVDTDNVKSTIWLRKGAALGSAECLYDLGVCYEYGTGVTKDEVEAYACYNIAAISIGQARHNLEAIEKKLPTEARLRGQQRSRELQREIEAKKAGN
jgi:TPR repeat protein